MKKRLNIIALLMIIALSLTNCSKSTNNVKNISGDNSKENTGYVTSYPTPVSGALHNPGMGWISLEEQTELGKLDLGGNGILPEVDNIGIQTSWHLIEKSEGVFDWSLIDKTIEYWTGQGKRINFRICTDSLSLPEVYFGAPSWLNEEPYNVGYQEWTYSGAVMARVNDITDPVYQEYFERFISELANRYADNPYLDTIDIRGYGMFGEWHSGHNFENMEERMLSLAYIIDKYAEAFAFEGKTVYLSNSWDYQGMNEDGSSAATNGNCSYEDYLAWSAIDHAMKINYVGYRRDGMSGNGVTKYATDEKALADLIRSGKKVSNCGEFFSGYETFVDGRYGMNPVEAVEEMIFKSRANYSTVMGWVNGEVANIVDAGDEEVFNRGNEKLGYRFKVDMAKYPALIKQGQTAHILTKISNSGVGRFTLPRHNIRLYLIDSNGAIKQEIDNKEYDLRILLNGEILNAYTDIEIDKSLENGSYTLAISIVDDEGTPSIRLGQVGSYEQMIYPLGKIEVGAGDECEKFYEEFTASELSSYKFKGNSSYELTFEYTPSVKLEDHIMGDENGFVVEMKDKKGNVATVVNFQDVSEEKAIKTVTINTLGNGPYTVSIKGTGIYENKIKVGKIYIENKTGYVQNFDENYNLLSVKNAWYCDNEGVITEDKNLLGTKGSLAIIGNTPHSFNDGLITDPNLLELKPKTSYTLSFSSKGRDVGGNAAYYYVRLLDDGKEALTIGEWYDRGDEPNSIKSFTFTTPDIEGLVISFGVKNIGSYNIDNINIIENPTGIIVNGENVDHVNNVRPYDEEKGIGYTEGFENMVLNDSTFTYGFNRWGSLTKDSSEVISGNYSFTSKLEDETFKYFNDNWFEFMYSNPKYIKLKANTEYRVRFTYKVLEEIVLNTNNELPGYCYIMARSASGAPDVAAKNFGANVELNKNKAMIYDFTTGAADDYKIIIGVYGRGNVIVDDISIVEK